MYDIHSSIVGSTVLVLPNDPLFDTVCKMVGVRLFNFLRICPSIIARLLDSMNEQTQLTFSLALFFHHRSFVFVATLACARTLWTPA